MCDIIELHPKSKLFKSYREEIEQGQLREARIIKLKNYIASRAGNCSMSYEEIDALHAMIADKPLTVAPAQSDKGLTWLLDKWRTATGKERKHNPFDDYEQSILKDFHHFTFEGFHVDGGERHGRDHVYPIYVVHDSKGNYFKYISGPWIQWSDNNIEITDTYYTK